MAWTYCTKSDVIAFFPIAESELRDEWSEVVEGLIADHLGQRYLGGSQAITGEYHSGDNTQIMRVTHTPILSVQALYVNDVALTADDYVVFPHYIQLKSQVFPRSNLNVVIDYTAGSVGVDETVRLAAISMVIATINYRKRAGADTSLKWGAADQNMGEGGPVADGGLIKHLKMIMMGILKRPYPRIYF